MAILSAGLFTSCSDFLTEEPKQEQSNELTFATFDGVNKAAAAMYGMFQSDAWYDGEFTLMSELRCGNAKNPTSVPGSGRYRSDTQWIYSDRSTSPLWSYAYYTIARANNVINNLDDKVGKDATQQQVNNVKAEALFIRALCYFDLVITYCQPYNYNATEDDKMGVPLVLVTENGKPARDSKENVYNQIVADLLQAESIMADDYVRAGVTDKAATPTKPAIQALLSRVYLYMNKWQEAADYATKVINNKKYELAPADAYAAMFSAATAPEGGEIIFEVYGRTRTSIGTTLVGLTFHTSPLPMTKVRTATFAPLRTFTTSTLRATYANRCTSSTATTTSRQSIRASRRTLTRNTPTFPSCAFRRCTSTVPRPSSTEPLFRA